MLTTKSWRMSSTPDSSRVLGPSKSNDSFEPAFPSPFLFANISAPLFSQASWQTLPEHREQRTLAVGKLPVTVLWVFKLFYDTPAPGARRAHNERLGHCSYAMWNAPIRHLSAHEGSSARASGRVSAI